MGENSGFVSGPRPSQLAKKKTWLARVSDVRPGCAHSRAAFLQTSHEPISRHGFQPTLRIGGGSAFPLRLAGRRGGALRRQRPHTTRPRMIPDERRPGTRCSQERNCPSWNSSFHPHARPYKPTPAPPVSAVTSSPNPNPGTMYLPSPRVRTKVPHARLRNLARLIEIEKAVGNSKPHAHPCPADDGRGRTPPARELTIDALRENAIPPSDQMEYAAPPSGQPERRFDARF